jgi:predicted NUDIX family NTP pyrophosphohydrolase
MPTSDRGKPAPLSAGLLLYRVDDAGPSVLLGHPGGPFFRNKDFGAWSIPKGLVNDDEDLEAAAQREFEEEVGWRPVGQFEPLGEVRLRSGKRVVAFALRSDQSEEELLARFSPGQFTMEWPPRSGVQQSFPEIDRVAFFSLAAAHERINPGQTPFISRLERLLSQVP